MKPWWKSKTLWFNALLSLLTVVEQYAAILKPALGESSTAILLFAATAGNAYLRAITTQAISVKPPTQ